MPLRKKEYEKRLGRVKGPPFKIDKDGLPIYPKQKYFTFIHNNEIIP